MPNPWIEHPTLICHDGVDKLPASFEALVLDPRGISTKSRIFIRRQPVESWAEPLGPWIEGLLGRPLDEAERRIFEDCLYEIAGLWREDAAQLVAQKTVAPSPAEE